MSIVSELNIFTDLTNEHCTLEFDLLDNVVSGNEVIVTDDFIVKCNDRDFTNLEYYLKLNYYYIPADVDGSRSGEIPIERLIKLDVGNNTISFSDYPIYLSGDCELIVNKINEEGYKIATTQVKLTSDSSNYYIGQDIILTAKVTHNGLPVSSQTVTFKDGTTTLGTATTNSSGIATYTKTGGLTGGTHNLTAVYSDFKSRAVTIDVETTHILEFTVTGYLFSTDKTMFPIEYATGTSILIDWGDDTKEEQVFDPVNGTKLTHNYSTSGTHTVKIYGEIESIGQDAFMDCTNLITMTVPSSVTTISHYGFNNCRGLTSITLPKTLQSIGYNCFGGCFNLATIVLNWDSANEIPEYYPDEWYLEDGTPANLSIPNGTTSLYTAKHYPSNRLIERS